MKNLFTLDIKNYFPHWNKNKRDSSRGIIISGGKKDLPLSQNDKISLVFAKNQGYYKFPGGGINADEDKIEALKKEGFKSKEISIILSTLYNLNKNDIKSLLY